MHRAWSGRLGGRIGVTVLLVTAALALVACNGAPAPVGPAPTAPPGPAPRSAPVAPAPLTAGPEPTAPAEQPTSWRMPNLVGRGLQDAQDAIQALTGNRIFLTKSHDATGAGRHQVLDRDWKVCDQNVRPGATITTDTVIDFGAVKLAERC
jgi:hypothetical protein